MERRQGKSTKKVGKKKTHRQYRKACREECAMKGYDGDVDEPKRKRKRSEPSEAKTSNKEDAKEEVKQTTE